MIGKPWYLLIKVDSIFYLSLLMVKVVAANKHLIHNDSDRLLIVKVVATNKHLVHNDSDKHLVHNDSDQEL